MNLGLIFTTSFIIALSGALAPGPLLTVTISYSLKRGFISGPLIILGHSILELILLIIIISGLGRILQIPVFIKIVFIIGGIILILMGTNLMFSSAKLKIKKTKLKNIELNPVLSGIIISLSNPYWLIWWITIGMAYIIKSMKYKFLGIAAFFTGHILADLLWYSFISFSFSKGRKFISDKVYHIIISVCGIFIIIFGFWFLYGGLK